ncbi:MAG: helix-turn-helix domain-containing protein [Thermoguttaceae bacterium]
MSIGQWDAVSGHAVEAPKTSSVDTSLPSKPAVNPVAAAAQQPMQRLASVRRMQGLSRRAVARRLNVEVDEVRRQECDTTDLPLSVIYAWQKAMDVPLVELLIEGGETSASPIFRRAQLVRLMKTVLAVRDQAKQDSIRRMAQTMWEQLVEIMPELAHVSPWHAVGKRRRLNELGIAAHRHLAENVFIDRPD